MADPKRLFANVSVSLDTRPDGSMLFKSTAALPALDRCVGDWLERWADEDPSRPFLMERDPAGPGWLPLTFGEARSRVHAIATWLLGQNVSAERPIVVLSGNSPRHALLSLAAMHIGVPICPVSTGWSLLAEDHEKLRDALALLTPGLVYVEDLDAYRKAVDETLDAHDGRIISAHGAGGSIVDFAELEGHTDERAVRNASDRVGHDTVAKLLFTSGSVGLPKAVITTQRMLVSNMAAKGLLWSFLTEEPPVLLDWLPWSHTFAGNQNLDMVLKFGGTMYLDTGRPTPELFGATVRNIKSVSPTIYSTVPRVYELLLPRLRDDVELRAAFFRRLRLMHYAGSTLPDHLFAEIRAIARASASWSIPLVSSWGSTETAPMATDCHFEVEQAGNLGVPIPGTVLKLVPTSGSFEVRVIGPNVTPGYWRAPDTTLAAFDDEGYYRIGDAVALVDAERPEAGLRFEGRVSEDFKLSTGTWVRVGAMKARAIAALSPIASDVVVAGAGHDSPGLLVFPDLDGCRLVADLSRDAPLSVVVEAPAIRRHILGAMREMSAAAGSSMYPTRCLLLGEVPSREGGEITDKGYINQQAVLTRRANLVANLFADPPPGSVVALAPRAKIVTPPLVELDVADQIATMTLARPDKRNAISDGLLADLDAALDAVPEGTRAIVLAGRGEHFCAGLDLSELEELTAHQVLAHSQSWQRVFSRIQLGGIPVIAALHGGVIGGGLELAAATHIRVAEPDTFFQLPEGRHGIFVGGGGSVRVARIIGTGRMCEMMLTNRRLDVDDGYAFGLVHYRVAQRGGPRNGQASGRGCRGERAGQQPCHHDGPPPDRQHGQR